MRQSLGGGWWRNTPRSVTTTAWTWTVGRSSTATEWETSADTSTTPVNPTVKCRSGKISWEIWFIWQCYRRFPDMHSLWQLCKLFPSTCKECKWSIQNGTLCFERHSRQHWTYLWLQLPLFQCWCSGIEDSFKLQLWFFFIFSHTCASEKNIIYE